MSDTSLHHPQAFVLRTTLCSQHPRGFPTVTLKFKNLLWRNNDTEQLAFLSRIKVKELLPNRDSLYLSPIKNITLNSRQYHTSQENQLLSYSTCRPETRRKSRKSWAPARTQRQPRRSPYPIWRLVEGACVMTELDWGDGMACWITTLVSWLGIRALPSWWVPGPAMAPPTGLCIEIFCPEKTEGKRSQEVNALFCSQTLKGQTGESGHVN